VDPVEAGLVAEARAVAPVEAGLVVEARAVEETGAMAAADPLLA
jgi:hypothetical protein